MQTGHNIKENFLMAEDDFENIICIPKSFLIVLDDVGWWCGNDDRESNGPARSGLYQRRHCLEDYKSIVRIGKSLNMRIKCGFVIGEWDRTNLLARIRNSNQYGDKWDNISNLDPGMDDVRDFINSSQAYMEMAVHGLMHMYWDDCGKMQYTEFYQNKTEPMDTNDSVKLKMTRPDIVREHLDAYFEIFKQNGLKSEIKSYIPPGFRHAFSKDQDQMSSILAEYGIRYISTPYSCMYHTTPEKPSGIGVENGIITVDRTNDLTKWYEISPEVPEIIKSSYFGMHWVNILNEDTERNAETADKWIRYFGQYKHKFDILVAKNNAMASSQALYEKYVSIVMQKISGRHITLSLDFSIADKQRAAGLLPEVFLNIKSPYVLQIDSISVAETEVEVYERHPEEGYTTYKITRKGNVTLINISLVLSRT